MRSVCRLAVVLAFSCFALVATAQSTAGYLGLVGKPVTRELSRSSGLAPLEGVHVVEVVPGGPAASAGLHEGDVIINLEGRKVIGPESLAERIASRAPGARVRIEVARQRQRIILDVVLGTPRSGPTRSDLPKAVGGAVRAK